MDAGVAEGEEGQSKEARRRLNILSDHLYLMKGYKDTRGGEHFAWEVAENT